MPVYIVTGASSGIGRATAEALAARGAIVLVAARRSEPLDALATAHPDRVHPVCADLATEAGVAALVEATARFEHIDGVVHAAGSLVPVEPYTDLDPEALSHHFRVHVATPIEINNRLRSKLSGGRLIYIDSYSAGAPRDGWSGYSIVKSGAQMAARAAAQELDDIDIVRVFPGGVRTPLVEAVLASPNSGAGAAFRRYDEAGDIVEPATVGEFIARIARDVPRSALATTEHWDINDPATHRFG